MSKLEKDSPDYTNKSLDKSLSILDMFDSQKAEWTVTEIAKKIDTNPSSLYPILHTLEKHGYLRRDDDKKYRLGLSLARKGSLVLEQLDLSSEAKVELEKLRDKTGKTVHLGYLNEIEVVYIDKVESTSGIRLYSSPGKTAPLHATALGKAILANVPESRLEKIFSKIELTPQTDKTITFQNELLKEIERVKERGYAIDDEEFEKGVRCIAAPIYRYDGKVDAAVSITGLSAQMKDDKIKDIASQVLQHAKNISSKLGFESG